MVEARRTPKIIVSYRRSDSGTAGRIFDRLVGHFGEKQVFIDIDNIPFGADFREHISQALEGSDLLVAIVGKEWLGPNADGQNRINDSTDPVRVEIETALQGRIVVFPVLVDNANMPDAKDLPDNIREFAYRNAAEVTPGRDFHFHVDRLIRSIDEILGSKLGTESAARESDAYSAHLGKVATHLGKLTTHQRKHLTSTNVAIVIAALCSAVLSGVVLPIEGLNLGAPLYSLQFYLPPLFFGLVLTFSEFFWANSGWRWMWLKLIGVIFAWLAAYILAYTIGDILRQSKFASSTYLTVAGFVGGAAGAAITALAIPTLRRGRRWAVGTAIGGIAGLFLFFNSNILYVVWQTSLATYFALCLGRPPSPKNEAQDETS